MSKKPKDYSRLKELLVEQETFPLTYVHKFIGKNSPQFLQALALWEKKFSKARQISVRLSKGDAHAAVTYEFLADHVDEVIVLLEATDQLPDLIMVL